MEYRVLGKTGLKISRLGFGGIPIQRIDAEGTKKLMHKLKAAGINYIDTARGYTVSEEYLGYGLEGIREHFVIATKSMSRTKEAMAKDIEISLKNLRTDYIDLYQIHNPTAKDLETVQAPGGALEALLEAKAAGKIGHIGVTLHAEDLLKQAVNFDWAETIMFPYNLVETQAEKWIKVCTERNIGFITMKPLAGGAIAVYFGKPRCYCGNSRYGRGKGIDAERCRRRGYQPSDGRRTEEDPFYPKYSRHSVLSPVQLLCALQRRHCYSCPVHSGRLLQPL